MNKLILVLALITTFAFISCNGENSSNDNNSSMNHDTMNMPMNDQTVQDQTKEVKTVTATFTNVDPAVSSHMNSMAMNYLAVKNALANGNENEAAAASGKMAAAMNGFDKSLLSVEQKKVYDGIEDDLEEQAAQVAKSNLATQREHFATMSKYMYNMVRAFGADMTLYHDHCPMYKNGSMWLSETKDIKNPYYDKEMMTCGSVEEMMK